MKTAYRYHLESLQPSDVPYRRVARFIGGGKVTANSFAEAQAKIIKQRESITEDIIAFNLEKMNKPTHLKGKIVFSFDYDFTARDDREASEILNTMCDYWYNGDNDGLREVFADAISPEVADDVCLKISNATVEVED